MKKNPEIFDFAAAEKRIEEQNYSGDEMDLLIAAQVGREVAFISNFETRDAARFKAALSAFKNHAASEQMVTPLDLGDSFTGLHVTREANGKFRATYVDPKGTSERAKGAVEAMASSVFKAIFRTENKENIFEKPAHSSIPQHVVDALKAELGIAAADIAITNNRLQHSNYSNIPEIRNATNNHGAAYTAQALVALANGHMEVRDNRLWEGDVYVKDFSEEQSDYIGIQLRKNQAKVLRKIEGRSDEAEVFDRGGASWSENFELRNISRLGFALPSLGKILHFYLVWSDDQRRLQDREVPTWEPTLAPYSNSPTSSQLTLAPTNTNSVMPSTMNPTGEPSDFPSSAPSKKDDSRTPSSTPSSTPTYRPTLRSHNRATSIPAEELEAGGAIITGAAMANAAPGGVIPRLTRFIANYLPTRVASVLAPLGIITAGAGIGYGVGYGAGKISNSGHRRLEEIEGAKWPTQDDFENGGLVIGTGIAVGIVLRDLCRGEPKKSIQISPFLAFALTHDVEALPRPDDDDAPKSKERIKLERKLEESLDELAKNSATANAPFQARQNIAAAIQTGRIYDVRSESYDITHKLSDRPGVPTLKVVNERIAAALGARANRITLPINSIEYQLLEDAVERVKTPDIENIRPFATGLEIELPSIEREVSVEVTPPRENEGDELEVDASETRSGYEQVLDELRGKIDQSQATQRFHAVPTDNSSSLIQREEDETSFEEISLSSPPAGETPGTSAAITKASTLRGREKQCVVQ